MQTLQTINRRTIHFSTIKSKTQKTKKVGDILKNLGLNVIGAGTSDLSVSHDNLLYK